MDAPARIEDLHRQGATVESLFDGVDEAAARVRPAPEKWSLLEVLGHLIDEERDDFRARLRMTLEEPAREWPPIDPVGWARHRGYNERALEIALAEYRLERASSIVWLRGLSALDLDSAHEHPRLGRTRAGDLLAAWVAHDLLHIRQIVNLRLALVERAAAPYSIRYASP